ncbi:hypothetical protein [Glutamicibacter sp. NPDC087673]|uniref:hypothetical protein n=1 Tax=Glutamicibacter sp. NPDC087673 TaxID=3363997 RepID=UPI00381D5115
MKKLLTASSLIAAAILVLLAGIFINISDRYFPLGAGSTVLVSLEDSTASRAEVLQSLTEWSDGTAVPLYLQAPADEDPTARVLYSLGSTSPEERLAPTSFLPWHHMEILSAADLGSHSLEASYVPADASAEQRASFTKVIESLGGQAWWTNYDWRQMLMQSLAESGAALALLTSGVLVVTSVLMWGLSRARLHDLEFLAGKSNVEIIRGDLGVLIRRVALPIGLLASVAGVTVLILSGLQYAVEFMSTLAVALLILLSFILIIWALVVALSWPTRQAIARREFPGAGFGAPSEMLRLLSVGITALTLPFLVSGLIGAQQAADQAQEWSRLDGWVSIRASSADGELEDPVKEAARAMSSREQLAFSKAISLYSGPAGSDSSDPTLSVIITDMTFLKLMGIESLNGADWNPAHEADLPQDAAQVMKDSLPLWLADSDGLKASGVHFMRWQGEKPFAAISGVTGEMEFESTPTVIVVDNAGESLTGNLLLSSASTGNLLFSNADAVRQSFDANGASDVILSVDRAADSGLLRAQLLNQTLWLRWLSLGLVLSALALTIAVGAQVWAHRLSRRIFVQRTAGFSWAWIARWRIIWESISAIFISALSVLFLKQLELSPWWALLLPLTYLPMSVYLHSRALRHRFTSLISRSP